MKKYGEGESFYRDYNAEADAFQAEELRILEEAHLEYVIRMLRKYAGEDLEPWHESELDYDSYPCSSGPYNPNTLSERYVRSPKWWFSYEYNHPKLKWMTAAKRTALARQARPGETWDQLLSRLGV